TLKYTTIKKERLFPANCLQPVGTVLLHCRRSPISKISVSDGEWQSATVGFNASRRRSLAHPDFLSSQSLFGFQAQIPSCSVAPTSSLATSLPFPSRHTIVYSLYPARSAS